MLDPVASRVVRGPLRRMAAVLARSHIHPDQVTLIGFGFGVAAVLLLWAHWYGTALFCIAVNRIMDGLDGALARESRASDAGGFLDICLDFLFYAGVVVGFALADPQRNALWAVILLFGFFGTGTSFLAFAIMAQKQAIASPAYPNKSFAYLGGLTEGTETIIFFVLICLFPEAFPWLAGGFSLLCMLTAAIRIRAGYRTIRNSQQKKTERDDDTIV